MNPAVSAAVALLGAAVRGGVRDIVLSPGARSQALALVAAELERLGAVRLHVRIDERVAGFFALGLAREAGVPVPVITTSGSAVANLHPALVEAWHSGVPVVALTADRPAELVGTGANQTTVQPGMFGPLVRCLNLPAPAEPVPKRPVFDGAGGISGSDPKYWTFSYAAAQANGDVYAAAGQELAATRGPLHINLPVREPLSGPLPDLRGIAATTGGLPKRPAFGGAGGISGSDPKYWTYSPADSSQPQRVEAIDPADWPFAIVIAGDRAGAAAERVASQGGWPLIAEVSSGAHFGPNLVVAYRELLGANSPIPGLRDGLELALVFGHPTLSRVITALLARPGLRVIVVDTPGMPPFAPRPDAEHVDAVRVLAFAATRLGASDDMFQLRREAKRMLADWVAASRALTEAHSSDAPAPDVSAQRSDDLRERARFGREELAVSREPVTREMLVDAVWRHTWPHDRLVVGASRLIRVLDARAGGKKVTVHANRGLAGIDGTIATGLGVAATAPGITRILLGDLAFVHDASALLSPVGEPQTNVQVIVGNDEGGSMFDLLEVARTAEAAAYQRVMRTPSGIDIGAVAAAYGWQYHRATTRAELEAALTTPGRLVIEAPFA